MVILGLICNYLSTVQSASLAGGYATREYKTQKYTLHDEYF
jgi:hypothetical protein